MAINVGPDLAKPTHHVKLTKDSTELGLILCDMQGKMNERSARNPFPNTAIKTYTGDAKYSDREPPFMDLIQNDWSLGRGQENFEDDKSRFQDSQEVDTTSPDRVILGGQPTFSRGIKSWIGYMPGSVEWKPLYDDKRYVERGVTTTAAFDADLAEILLKKVGIPYNGVTVELWNDAKTVQYKSIVINSVDITTDLLSVWLEANWTGEQTLSASTVYRLMVFATSSNDDVNNHWEIAGQAGEGLNASKSPNGTDWTSTPSWGIYFRIFQKMFPFTAHFIEYRKQLYFGMSKDTGAGGLLYMNGARGACDPNTGTLDRLKDSIQTGWTTQPGEVAELVGGNAVYERLDWRKITGSGSGYVTVLPDWEITHQITDEYVILGSDDWVERAQSSLIKPVSDIEVANDIMFIAQTHNAPMYQHREVNDQGTFRWTNDVITSWAKAGANVDYVVSILDYISGPVLWMARNDGWHHGDGLIFRDVAPVAWKDSPIGYITTWDGSTALDEQVISNVTYGMEGKEAFLKVAAGFTTGVIGSKNLVSSVDIRLGSYVCINVKSSIDLAAGILEILFDNTANCASPTLAIALPAFRAGDWVTPIRLDIDPSGISGAEAIISVGFRLTQDVAAVDLYFSHGIRLYTKGSYPISIGDANITGLERYGEPETCYVMAEDQIGEVRNNSYQPVPLRELKSVRSSDNGRAHLVHDVYLYFSLKDGLEKYYRNHMDDIGPNRDMGLPENRRGPIVDLAGYPGKIFAAVDAGDDGYSSVLCLAGGGWHEVYRSRFIGRRIRKIHLQSIPGKKYSRLWISEHADVLWVPVALNPSQDADYRYTYESALISSRIFGGMQDILKFFKAVKLATKNLNASSEIRAWLDYRTDESTTWTRISTAYETSPFQEQDLSSTMNVSGRWIELRLVLETGDNTKTPEIIAYVIKSILREESKYANTYTFRVKDWDRDIQGNPIDETVSSFMTKLENMINEPLPMYVNSISDLDDSMYVVAQPATLKRLRVIQEEDGREVHVCQLTTLEV